jgi:hypothetical protein
MKAQFTIWFNNIHAYARYIIDSTCPLHKGKKRKEWSNYRGVSLGYLHPTMNLEISNIGQENSLWTWGWDHPVWLCNGIPQSNVKVLTLLLGNLQLHHSRLLEGWAAPEIADWKLTLPGLKTAKSGWCVSKFAILKRLVNLGLIWIDPPD